MWGEQVPVMGCKNTLRPGIDYDQSSCPACGSPECDFPPACQRVVMDMDWQEDLEGDDWWEMRGVR